MSELTLEAQDVNGACVIRVIGDAGFEIAERLDMELARQRLQELNGARSLDVISRLRSVGLHKLKGDRKGYWAINANGHWRIVFRFKDGDAYDVEILDYH